MPLLSVLWTIALLAVIAAATLGSGTTSYQQARNIAEAARQDAHIEAATNRAVLALLDQRQERRWPIDGRPQRFAFDEVEMTLSIQDELGKVDLNHADVPLITAALRGAGLSAQAASELADKILDWRDKGSSKRLHGAKAADYAAAGLPYGPRGGPFQSVEELKLVLGVTPNIFASIAPLVTVHSGRPMIDTQSASPRLLAALNGREQPQRTDADPHRPGLSSPGIPLEGRAFSVRVELDQFAGGREVVLRLTADPSQAHWLLSWRAIEAD